MDKTDNKLIIRPKDDKYVTMTIRTEKKIQEEYNKLSARTNRSRNELISMALKYALDNMIIDDDE
ncbi:MAG TPA: CopG family transcriptional regulator [Candidatus Anaerobutyricum faecale]|uniref:CopG family transcriptional regulator n=1 Tax=Eubacterium sp. An11 TaxID=1965542 RepID=UPI000B398F77|nr:CopG family transcriptional regulator [Eubacterium sp. An11]OUQ63158.1 CopG family transcriptional regulator [Eubacterium sp. An11]HJC30763.1 CopG family transcriptional regulator [Candidatus Anaerobutyricum faecale]